jgi:hypothetical protein
VSCADDFTTKRRRHVAEQVIPRAIGDLLAANRKSNEILAAAL